MTALQNGWGGRGQCGEDELLRKEGLAPVGPASFKPLAVTDSSTECGIGSYLAWPAGCPRLEQDSPLAHHCRRARAVPLQQSARVSGSAMDVLQGESCVDWACAYACGWGAVRTGIQSAWLIV